MVKLQNEEIQYETHSLKLFSITFTYYMFERQFLENRKNGWPPEAIWLTVQPLIILLCWCV